MEKRFIYCIGDGVSPGSWKRIDGYWLEGESCAELSPQEDFKRACLELREDSGFDCRFALVITEFEEGEEMESYIEEIFE